MYIEYFKYILEHKKNVFIEAIKMIKEHTGPNARYVYDNKTIIYLFTHAITHDLSKFSPSEFFAYAKYFHGDKDTKEKSKDAFNKAWLHHYTKNKHHWDHWYKVKDNGGRMQYKYILQMIVDWRAMGRKFGDTAQSYYLNNYHKIQLSNDTRNCLEYNLGLKDFPFQLNDEWYHAPICDIFKSIRQYKEANPLSFNDCYSADFVPYYKDKFNIDITKLDI